MSKLLCKFIKHRWVELETENPCRFIKHCTRCDLKKIVKLPHEWSEYRPSEDDPEKLKRSCLRCDKSQEIYSINAIKF